MQQFENKGSSLDPDFLILAYTNGYFPMASSRSGPIEWFSPDPRAIIPLDKFKISRTLRQTLKKKKFDVRIDTSFELVMRYCASRDDTWISKEIMGVYVELHRRGLAHSVEIWDDGSLVGGLYGVAIGGAFFGESMFSHTTDSSKVALVHLVERLRERNFALLDTQFITDHLRTFGTVEIPRTSYLQLLTHALEIDTTFIDRVE